MAITIKKETLKNGTTTYKFKELETVLDVRILSDYEYAITRNSFHDYLYKLGLSEREVNCIMEYI